jgi:formylglycine-generating enzyme required for sulfatase activity
MPAPRTTRIFISSPADVRPERLKAEQIIARLAREFANHLQVQAILWEREPLVASHHFQERIPQPREMDVVVVILWSRLGVLLPEDRFRGAISGGPATGTEWEFEEALAAARKTGVPELLVYRKTAEPSIGLGNRAAVQEQLDQLDQLEEFIVRWFKSGPTGGFTAALHSFERTAQFEDQLYGHLRALLERRANALDPATTIRWHDAPFRGLLSFEFEHASVFFGRTRARNDLRELLARRAAQNCAFVLVLGASGSGKSSLVKAGLLPDLMLPGMIGQVALVRRALMRPTDAENDPITALASAILSGLPELTSLQYSPASLVTMLRDAPAQAVLPIRQGLASAGDAFGLTGSAQARLALVVDQLEELFTIETITAGARELFVTALDALARSGLVWVVGTMRSDFFDQLEKEPRLASLSAEARYLVLPPDDAEIGQIIRQPALEAGLRFEVDPRGIGLDEYIRQAASTQKGALPLLSFLLDQLWRRRREGGVLTFTAYEALGRLEGAIGQRAEEVFLAQPERVHDELIAVLRALVTVKGITAASRPAQLSAFPRGSPRRQLVDAFLEPAARLLIADAEGGEPRLRLAHEALLTNWPRARDQIAMDARDLELRDRLEQEAERWRMASPRDKAGRVRGPGLPLAEARALVSRWGSELPQEVRQFVLASQRVAGNRRLRLAATIPGVLIALMIVACIAWTLMVWRGVQDVEAVMAFVVVPSGCFEMGSAVDDKERYADELPQHRVCLKSFELGAYEVTQDQWARVMIFPHNPAPSRFKGASLPVDSVSWNDVQQFIWLMQLFGRYRYRLPSEAEWEYAARAGTTTSRYWGDNPNDGCVYENIPDQTFKREYDPTADVADCDDGYPRTAPIGSFKQNPWHLYDILGNVSEWVADCYINTYKDAPGDGTAVLVADCPDYGIRGGSWNGSKRAVRAARRTDGAPDNRNSMFGFRLIREGGSGASIPTSR